MTSTLDYCLDHLPRGQHKVMNKTYVLYPRRITRSRLPPARPPSCSSSTCWAATRSTPSRGSPCWWRTSGGELCSWDDLDNRSVQSIAFFTPFNTSRINQSNEWNQRQHRLPHLLKDIAFWCFTALLLLPNFHQPRQNWADSTLKIQIN